MRGTSELIKARLSGDCPKVVNVDLDLPTLPTCVGRIQVETDDRLSSADLRCVQGLTVAVSGEVADRAHAFAALCKQSGAARVITTISRRTTGGCFEVVEVVDTKGILTWKQ